jgi:hypothetical protein
MFVYKYKKRNLPLKFVLPKKYIPHPAGFAGLKFPPNFCLTRDVCPDGRLLVSSIYALKTPKTAGCTHQEPACAGEITNKERNFRQKERVFRAVGVVKFL